MIIADHPGNIVLSRNVSAKVQYRQSDLSNRPQTMPPTFLFLLYAVFKEPTVSSTVQNLSRSTSHRSFKLASQTRQRLVRGAGYLDQSNQPVNQFFRRNSQPYKPLFLQDINQEPARSTPPHLLEFNPKVKPVQQNTRANQPAASSAAALVVALYRPRKPKLSTSFQTFFDVFLTDINSARKRAGFHRLYIGTPLAARNRP